MDEDKFKGDANKKGVIKMVSELAKENAVIIAFCGPSGIGKGFIKEQLLQTYSFIEELVWFEKN